MVRVVFYHPPIINNYLVTAPLAYLHLQKGLEGSGHAMELIDGRVVDNPIEELLKVAANVDAILVGTMPGTQVKTSLEAISVVKEKYPNIVVIYGGALPTVAPLPTIKHELVDIVIQGRGELSIAELLSALGDFEKLRQIPNIYLKDENNEIVRGPVKSYKKEPLLIPQYDKYISDYEPYYLTSRRSTRMIDYISSIGCPFSCSFCSETAEGVAGWNGVPAIELVDHLVALKERYGADGVLFQDALFVAHKQRLHDFCDLMIEREVNLNWICTARLSDIDSMHKKGILEKMKIAGCEMLFLGAEAATEETLKIYKKGIKAVDTVRIAKLLWEEYQILPHFSYVLSYPVESMESVKKSLELHFEISELIGAPSGELGYYNPVYGTQYIKEFQHLYIVPEELEGWADFDFSSQKLYKTQYPELDKEMFRHNIKLRRKFRNVPMYLSYDIWQERSFEKNNVEMLSQFI
ncbi:MAG: hypothetical protein GQ574_00070 [Crocinitomix sp.]|nr:hypothetical protein [Crocinitomix sp.]